MKKTLSILLVILLALGISLPAAAAETLDSRLTAVTLAVKDTLDIPDTFDEFYGTVYEDQYTPYWSLNWSSDNEQLYITANESGKIFSYQYYSSIRDDYDEYSYSYQPGFQPIFPKVTRAAAKPYAEAFLNKVLTEGESVTFETYAEQPSDPDAYSFSGTLKINGLDSPFSVYLTVRTADMTVTDFSRSDLYTSVSGTIPSPVPSITPEDASTILSGTYELEPLYIITENDKPAHVVYVPRHGMDSVVDAKTGEIVTASPYYPMWERGLYGSAPAMEADMNTSGLTPAELEGIAILEDVYTGEELDAILRNEAIFGVTDDFIYQSTDYYVDRETDEVSASVSYQATINNPSAYGLPEYDQIREEKPEGEIIIYKSFELDAKTGNIRGAYTYYYGVNGEYSAQTTVNPLQPAVETWLKANFAEEFSASALYESSVISSAITQDSYSYCQKVNGYFFTANSLNVTVNTVTGTIDNLSVYWDDSVLGGGGGGGGGGPGGGGGGAAEEIVSADAALRTYADAYSFKLGYTLKPVGEPSEDYYSAMVYEMILAYSPVFDGYITGVDAVTGELLFETYQNDTHVLAYNDLSSSYAQEKIEALAVYGIGYYSDSFLPASGLTEKDMILLLISASGYKFPYDTVTGEVLDQIYSIAYDYGILQREQRSPDRKITRVDMVRTLVGMTSFKQAAELKGIFNCGFSDDSAITQADYGYVAIAKGLGIISGNPDGSFRPNETITRQEAAVMLYNYMDRES